MIEYVGKCGLIREKERKVLVVGDLHIGYEEFLNNGGIFISRKMFDDMILQFNKIFERVGKVDEIILLGDLKHKFGSILKQEYNDLVNLFDYLLKKTKDIIIIKGNHDQIVEPIALKREIKVMRCYIMGKYCFMHGDREIKEARDERIKFWIMGHGHPAIKLNDGVKTEKYKCFLEGEYNKKKIIIVPSFIDLNEGSDPRESDLKMGWDFKYRNFKVKVVGEDMDVLDFGKLKDIQ